MALLSLSNIEKSFGPREVLKGLSLGIERGDRLGLIGRNGCGKTTLLNIIVGKEEADRGEMHFARDLKLAWLDQDPKLDKDLTVWQEARKALADLEELEARLARWHRKIAEAPNHEVSRADHEAMALDEAAFHALAGEDRERLLGIALEKLGLKGELLERPCGQLSGGERTRLALAQFLVAPFDLLILDEPTNHLDIDAIEWLQSALLETARTFIVVSHDRAFLDAVCGKVAELDDGRLTVINGNYTQFVTVKAERLKALQRAADQESAFIEKEMEFIRRHINSQRTREAKGRLKKLERREVIEVAQEQRTFELKLRGGGTHADVVLGVSDLAKKMGERMLFSGLSFDLQRGEKLGIVGPNGAGKTTLAKVLLGQLPQTEGRLRLAPQLRVGTFTQDLSHLMGSRTVLEEYARHANPPNLNVARGPLGAYLFSGNRVEQKVGSLSGGEKARLALCILVSKDNDVLVLDEPTNHLDIPSRQALEESLSEYPGTCLIISHDRFFLDRVTNKTLWIGGAKTKVYLGSYSEARAIRDEELQPEIDAEEARKRKDEREKDAHAAALPPKPKKINEFKLSAIEKEIAELEGKKEKLNASLYDESVFRDGTKVREVSAELDEIEKQLVKLNKDWENVIDAAG
ncbi:MAG TPA: ABC-F family ATP-binding cassette domain-containing protein [Planctomycetota bacterium]|nr:ABC-F family ATP-binding cassette domain-containing protein [Planctomycetota bacterium]